MRTLSIINASYYSVQSFLSSHFFYLETRRCKYVLDSRVLRRIFVCENGEVTGERRSLFLRIIKIYVALHGLR
jgi:hypothetical protein